jgi:hypothetical protein
MILVCTYKERKIKMIRIFIFAFCFFLLCCACQSTKSMEITSENVFYNLNTVVESRSISFENPTGSQGEGGKVASHLGVGRKGFPAKSIKPGEVVTLCDIKGSGAIRHIWMTGTFKNRTQTLRSTVIRGYWENQKHPSIECPIGDFMGLAHAKVQSYQSAVHSVGINAALNIWLPMPFATQGKLTLKNESEQNITLFYQVDYTINDKHPKDFGRLHTLFRRENPTILKKDFEILPNRTGKGRFLGTLLGIRSLEKPWWGEGEIKIFMDGDTQFPTICGTGSEDYVCLSYGMQQTPFLYHGCNLNENGFISMYRWHLLDPIYWKKNCRITIQQIGWSREKSGTKDSGLYERQDDWSCATFWYESVPSKPLPEMPSLNERLADLVDYQEEE